MKYKRLNFEQYFIDTSKDYTNTGKARFICTYHHVNYKDGLFNCSGEWEMHYEKDRNVIQINFEKTEGIFDWLENFRFSAKTTRTFHLDDSTIELKVCKGWNRMYEAIKEDIHVYLSEMITLHSNAYIEIIGWSAGAGLAQICAEDIFYNFNRKSHVYTFGSVKPFKVSKKTINTYLKKCCETCYNFNNRSDIVGYLPPFFGYRHINLINIGKFNFANLFNPRKYHTDYYLAELYESVK